jgi:hypothetical protein
MIIITYHNKKGDYMNTEFKKGDKVFIFGNWDGKGTFHYEAAIIHSAGEQIIRLQDENGVLFNEAFYKKFLGQKEHIIKRQDVTDIQAHILPYAQRFLIDRATELEGCILRHKNHPDYIAAMNKQLAALHEPRVEQHNWPLKARKAV